ncbi:MAG: cytochrome c oxidase subunit 3 [Phycisphaerae bacterium]
MSLVAHQFDDHLQQREAATLGMWTFLATEILFFGGLFVTYTIYRWAFPHAFAEASHRLHEDLGAINTAVLLSSSFTIALCVHFARHHRRGAVIVTLIATIVLGLAFLGIKGTEYVLEYRDHLIPAINFDMGSWPADVDPRHAELFMFYYFVMTLLHATHMLVGLSLLTFLLIMVSRRHYVGPGKNTDPIEIIALYWHFVDIVWIFLLPCLYLVK